MDETLARLRGWAVEDNALTRDLLFNDFGSSIAFTVRLAMEADKRDHHPEILIAFRSVRVTWTTHDAGGITALDAELAQITDRIAEP